MPSTATKVTPEEYLERERAAEIRHEYRDGEIVAMSGARRSHILIVTNLVGELRQRLRHRPCKVYSTDLRVASRSREFFTYPDVIVTCGEERYLDDEFDTLQNPVLIIEVLSKTTQRYDRGEKFARYQTLPSLLEYVLVAQDEVRIEQWTRQPDERWLLTEFRKMEATIELASMAVSLPVAEIYEKVELPGPTS